jgi:transposase
LYIGSFTQDNFINILDKEARKSAENCLKTGADTIIVLDNYSIHKSPQVRAKGREGQWLALYLFLLPPGRSALNLIEGEWHQIKTHEISGRMFEDEYDLVQAVKESLTHRSAQVGDRLQHFKLNSKCINVQSQNE